MNDEDMRALAALRRTRSITHAAEELAVTQPTLTRRVQQIEAEFGAAVLERSNKGVCFTKKGEFLAERAERMLAFIEETKEAVRGGEDIAEGPVRIASANSYAEFTLPGLLKRYRSVSPQARFEARSMMSPDVLKLVRSGGADLGIVRGDFAWYGWKRLLSRDRCTIISRLPLDEAALPITPHIDYPLSAPNRRTVEKWWNERFRTPPMTVCRVSTLSIAKQMAAKEMGFAFSLVEDIDRGDELSRLPMLNADGSALTRDTVLIQSEGSAESRAVCAFRDWLVGESR